MAVDRKAAGQTAEARSQWPCPLEREDRRQAIVEAARALAAEKGFAAVTFSALAAKMGFTSSTIYGYFSNRQELLSQISVDESPEVERVDPVPTVPAAEPVPEPKTESDAHLDSAYGDLLKAQAEELEKLAKSIIVPNGQAREGTDATLAKLEIRLKVVERSYAELEKRRLQDVDDMRRRLDTSAETAKLLQQRLEEAEVRHRAAVAELRLSLFNLENPHAGKPSYVPPPEGDAGFVLTPDSMPSNESARGGARDGYLASARSAAIDSALAGHVARAPLFHMPRFTRQTKMAAALGLIVCAVGVGAWRVIPDAAPPQPVVATLSDRLSELAKAGNVNAELLLGVKYLNGEGAPPNVGKAVHWLTLAATHGQPVAQNYLGVLYRTGTGMDADMRQAARWFEMSALQGNRMAMANLGKLYAGGWKDGANFRRATRWFVRAAMLGDSDSAFNLAVLYERGDGVPESRFDAYKWYSIAAAAGDGQAARRANVIADQLPAEDQESAYLLAKEFIPQEPDRSANAMPSL